MYERRFDLAFLFLGRPTGSGRIRRPTSFANLLTNESLPGGRPRWVDRRIAAVYFPSCAGWRIAGQYRRRDFCGIRATGIAFLGQVRRYSRRSSSTKNISCRLLPRCTK